MNFFNLNQSSSSCGAFTGFAWIMMTMMDVVERDFKDDDEVDEMLIFQFFWDSVIHSLLAWSHYYAEAMISSSVGYDENLK